jgi:hypothetical protein
VQSVWVVDHGAQGDLGVVSMFATAELAAARLRQLFGQPFLVNWEPLEFSCDGDEAILVGHFAAVPGYSADHTAFFMMQRWDAFGL